MGFLLVQIFIASNHANERKEIADRRVCGSRSRLGYLDIHVYESFLP